MSEAVRVMVVDDQVLVLQGICTLLEMSERISVVGQARGGEEALAILRQCRPDVLLLDIRMPGMTGLDVLAQLAAWDDAPTVILLTTFNDDEALLLGMKRGASGYLLKDVSLELLVEAIHTVHTGATYIQPVCGEKVKGRLRHSAEWPGAEPATEALTAKELEVVRLLAAGYSNREIAQSTHKSEGTIKNQVSSVLNKLGVRDRTRAVLKALEVGILK